VTRVSPEWRRRGVSSWRVTALRIAPTVVIGVPFIALVLSPAMIIEFGMRGANVLGLMIIYCLTMGGITLGYHRALAHKGIDLSPRARAIVLMFGAMAAQGPPSFWVAHHRAHHGDPDGAKDPHSPWTAASGESPALWRVLYSHTGWMFSAAARFDARLARDVRKDRVASAVDTHYALIALAGLLLPAILANLPKLELRATLLSIYWMGLFRIGIAHQATWMVNSACHLWGYRNHATNDRSKNNWWVAALTLGEGWHNNHHASPRKAKHGERWWEFDPTFTVLRALGLLKLATYRMD
jgi:stearoyl-CoA desaturase (delta-9 desaturase)